ncbi:class II glutamine amidotransferase [Lentisphaerota bacterium ZTH]|nr:class II glutamine amidotransferase [Lentisphaerota bacterium]WET07255.1 class II glutamine amidotransferase [Lentisphaerota bacterium ZTH]
MTTKKLNLVIFTFLMILAGNSYACELFAFSFNKPVAAGPLLERFWKNGSNNPHGWGMVYKDNGKLKVIKEEIDASKSRKAAETVEMQLNRKLLVAHVRKMKIGKICFENTHPFKGKTCGKEFGFVQNGKVVDYRKYKQDNFKPAGSCDSEYYLCYLLDRIRAEKMQNLRKADLRKLHNYFLKMNAHKDNWTNNILTDGDKLIVYQDNKDFNPIKFFHYTSGQPESKAFVKELKITFPAETEGYLFSAKPVAAAKSWKKMHAGQMMVIENGKVIYDKLNGSR